MTRNDASKENTIVRKDSTAVGAVAIKDSSRDNSVARKDNSKNRIDSKKEDSLLVKDSSKDESKSLVQNGTIETKSENKPKEKAQENIVQNHKPIDQVLTNKEPIKQHTEETKSGHILTNGHDVKVRKSQKQFFLPSIIPEIL